MFLSSFTKSVLGKSKYTSRVVSKRQKLLSKSKTSHLTLFTKTYTSASISTEKTHSKKKIDRATRLRHPFERDPNLSTITKPSFEHHRDLPDLDVNPENSITQSEAINYLVDVYQKSKEREEEVTSKFLIEDTYKTEVHMARLRGATLEDLGIESETGDMEFPNDYNWEEMWKSVTDAQTFSPGKIHQELVKELKQKLVDTVEGKEVDETFPFDEELRDRIKHLDSLEFRVMAFCGEILKLWHEDIERIWDSVVHEAENAGVDMYGLSHTLPDTDTVARSTSIEIDESIKRSGIMESEFVQENVKKLAPVLMSHVYYMRLKWDGIEDIDIAQDTLDVTFRRVMKVFGQLNDLEQEDMIDRVARNIEHEYLKVLDGEFSVDDFVEFSKKLANIFPYAKPAVPETEMYDSFDLYPNVTGRERLEQLWSEMGVPLYLQVQSATSKHFGTPVDPVLVPSECDYRIVGCRGGPAEKAHEIRYHVLRQSRPKMVCLECGQCFQIVSYSKFHTAMFNKMSEENIPLEELYLPYASGGAPMLDYGDL